MAGQIDYALAGYCTECFKLTYRKKIIFYKYRPYCGAECLNDRINMDRQYEWLVFKNSIDIYDNEELLGSLTLLS